MTKGIIEKAKDSLEPTLEFFNTGFRPTFEFTIKNIKDLFFKFFKVHLIANLAAFILFIPILALAFIPLLMPSSEIASFIGRFSYIVLSPLTILVFYIVLFWIIQSISKTANIIVAEQYIGKYSGIKNLALQNANPIFFYIIAIIFIFLSLLGIPALILYFLKENTFILSFGLIIYIIYLALFCIAYVLFAQFWLWELLIAKKGVIESLKASISLASKNFFGLVIFDIPLLLILIIPFIAFYILRAGYMIVFEIILFAGFAINLPITIVLGIIGAIIYLAIVMSEFAISDIIYMPFMYAYWNHIRKTPTVAPKLSPKEKTIPTKRVKSVVKKKTSK